MSNPINRRNFIATTGTLATALVAAPARAGANDRIRCGVIGVGNRGTHLIRLALKINDLDIAAICDINSAHLTRAQEIVTKAGQKRPNGFGEKGPKDYRRMLESKDLDAVIVATPMQDHAIMSIDALGAGKAVLSEVAAAMTLDECWSLVRAVEETKNIYMMAENVCYFRPYMMILNMVQQGLFGGGFTYGECGYVHDCRFLQFNKDGTLTWRGKLARDRIGNLYPTHAIGPMAQWMGINRTDRFICLVSMSSRIFGSLYRINKTFGPDSPQAKIPFKKGDTTTTLIKTEKGALIDLRYDTASQRPHKTTVYQTLQGENASYRSVTGEIWIESKSKAYKWEPISKYAKEYDHPYWKKWEQQAAGTGHGGADFFVVKEFFDALRAGKKAPIDVYDAVTWSAIIPLSAQSIKKANSAVSFPDFKKNAKA